MFVKNEKDQTLTTNCEKIFSWNDMFLRSCFTRNRGFTCKILGGTQKTLATLQTLGCPMIR